MTNRQFRTTALLLAACAVFIVATGFQSGSMALVFKIVEDVTKKTSTADWTKALKGENLASGDQVKTGTHSLAIVKFLDNSILRVREQSVLTVSGEGSRRSQVKTILLNAGAFGFDVKKQRQNEQFRLTSPTSVASIRGTKGTWNGGMGNDTLVVVEGLVNLKNTVSNKDLDIPAGYIGFSNNDGFLSSRRGSAEELSDANAAASGISLNELNLELKDAKGNRKELKLKYHR